jgi:hypothetical protein
MMPSHKKWDVSAGFHVTALKMPQNPMNKGRERLHDRLHLDVTDRTNAQTLDQTRQ